MVGGGNVSELHGGGGADRVGWVVPSSDESTQGAKNEQEDRCEGEKEGGFLRTVLYVGERDEGHDAASTQQRPGERASHNQAHEDDGRKDRKCTAPQAASYPGSRIPDEVLEDQLGESQDGQDRREILPGERSNLRPRSLDRGRGRPSPQKQPEDEKQHEQERDDADPAPDADGTRWVALEIRITHHPSEQGIGQGRAW